MKKVKLFMVFLSTIMILAAVVDAQAATARVRCTVESNRLTIKVDGLDLAAGTYKAKVKNAKTGGTVQTASTKYQTVTVGPDDVDLDFDSTAQPNDSDTFVSFNFAKVGDTVRASVINVNTNVTVAAASAACIAK
jgi:exosome complex RNA-binding protein Csl4